ncbi:MAG: bifunctional heptose 7-phosphate kinase/heptose 1-phosphate adenyltransferase [Schlesneria sp.]|nr:bifunctional heptose 7-phosphate kinase/heptose 1-phosphate adenyltransferase [Schlesneria sp.]
MEWWPYVTNRLTCRTDQNQRPRIAVVGDIMVDVDLHCSCERIAQEGPWGVFGIERTQRRLGGAGNVALMLQAFEVQVEVYGAVGRDGCGEVVAAGFRHRVVMVHGRTTSKTRLWVQGRMTGPRLDDDLRQPISQGDAEMLVRLIAESAPDAIIVADHGKGVVTRDLMRQLGRSRIPVYVDPIKTTPGGDFVPAAMAGGPHELPGWCRANCVITKRGADGLHWRDGEREGTLLSTCRNLVDPLGAGDQFIAGLAYQRCLGRDWPQAIEWANAAAGLQCEQAGCHPVSVAEVEQRVETKLAMSEELR